MYDEPYRIAIGSHERAKVRMSQLDEKRLVSSAYHPRPQEGHLWREGCPDQSPPPTSHAGHRLSARPGRVEGARRRLVFVNWGPMKESDLAVWYPSKHCIR